jgi:hypothetical protein
MNTTHNLKRIISGALLSGALAVAGLGLAAGTAQAACTPSGVCSMQWCPGQPMPQGWFRGPNGAVRHVNDVSWDMTVCHTYFNATDDRYGGVRVGTNVYEGEPAQGNPCAGAPICLPGL